MRHRRRYWPRIVSPDDVDKSMMIETLVFIILIMLCAGGVIYMLIKLIAHLLEGVTVNIPV